MARRWIKPEHLHHLIDQLIAPKSRAELHEHVNSATLGGTEIVLRELDAKRPGLSKHLEVIWTDYGGTAAHLWSLPELDGSSADELVAIASKRLASGKSLAKQQVLKIPSIDDAWEFSIKRIAATPHGVDLVVLRRFTRESTFDEETEQRPETEPIRIVIEVTSDGVVLAEVYATTAKARQAFLYISGLMLASALPKRRSTARDQRVRPILFTEGHVHAVAKKFKMIEYGWEGPDATGNLSKIAVTSNLVGTRHEPLPQHVDEVKKHQKSAKDLRQYQCDFPHDDGFVEENKVAFYFGRASSSAHPHVTFRTRPSRLAVRAIVEELRNLAG